MLAAQYVTESKDVQDHVNVAMRQVGHTGPRNQVPAGTVRDSSSIETMIGKDNAHKFLHQIRGIACSMIMPLLCSSSNNVVPTSTVHNLQNTVMVQS